MARRKKFRERRFTTIAGTALSALIGFIVIFIIVLLFAFLMTKIDATDTIVSAMTACALCVGAYTGGFISAKRRRKNGLLMGILCGVFMFFVIFILSTFCVQTIAGLSGSTKLIMTLICSAIGGIVGVNSKHSKY